MACALLCFCYPYNLGFCWSFEHAVRVFLIWYLHGWSKLLRLASVYFLHYVFMTSYEMSVNAYCIIEIGEKGPVLLDTCAKILCMSYVLVLVQ